MRATIDNLLHIFAIFVQTEQTKHEIYSKTRCLTSKRLTKAEFENSSELEHNNHNHQMDSSTNHCLPTQISIKNGKHDDHYSLSKSHSSVDMNHMMPPPTSMIHHHHNVPIFSLTTDKVFSQPIQIQQDRSVLIAANQQR